MAIKSLSSAVGPVPPDFISSVCMLLRQIIRSHVTDVLPAPVTIHRFSPVRRVPLIYFRRADVPYPPSDRHKSLCVQLATVPLNCVYAFDLIKSIVDISGGGGVISFT
jgi:hypothetical protein